MSTRTSKKDLNFLSLDSTNAVWFAGTDEWRYEPGPIPTDILPKTPENWDAVLKFSYRGPTHLTGLRVSQGRENSVDINNRCHHLDLSGKFGLGTVTGDQCLTIKGGSTNITISGTIYSTGKNCCVAVGAWSDQSLEKSTDLDFSGLRRADGKPVTFILSRCERVKLPENSKILEPMSLGYSIYWHLKRLAVKLHLLPSK